MSSTWQQRIRCFRQHKAFSESSSPYSYLRRCINCGLLIISHETALAPSAIMPSTSIPLSCTRRPMVRSRSDEPSFFLQDQSLQDRDDRAESGSSPRTGGPSGTGRDSTSKASSRILKILGNHSSRASSTRSSNDDGNEDLDKLEDPSGRTGSLGRRARKLFSVPETGSGQTRRWIGCLLRKRTRNRYMSEQQWLSSAVVALSSNRQRSRSDTNELDRDSSRLDSERPRRRFQRKRETPGKYQDVQIGSEDHQKARSNSSENDRDSLVYRSRRPWRYFKSHHHQMDQSCSVLMPILQLLT
jgi:hypothetical protein